MRKTPFFLVPVLLVCMLAGCSSSQTLQDQYDKGYDDGYSEGEYNATHDLSEDDISDELAREIAHQWIINHQDELIDSYGYIFSESNIGYELYDAGYSNACYDFNITQEQIDTHHQQVKDFINNYNRQSPAPEE